MAPCSDLHHKNLIKQYLASILDFKNIWYCLFIFWATPKPCFLENSWGISLSGACMRNSLWSFGPHGRELWGQRESYVHLVNTAMVMIRTCSGGLCTDIHRRASFSVLFWRDSADTIFTTGISVCPEHNFKVSNETFTWIPDITAHIHFLSSCPPGLSSEMAQPRKRSPPTPAQIWYLGFSLGLSGMYQNRKPMYWPTLLGTDTRSRITLSLTVKCTVLFSCSQRITLSFLGLFVIENPFPIGIWSSLPCFKFLRWVETISKVKLYEIAKYQLFFFFFNLKEGRRGGRKA